MSNEPDDNPTTEGRTSTEQYGDIRQALDTWLRDHYCGSRSVMDAAQAALDKLWEAASYV